MQMLVSVWRQVGEHFAHVNVVHTGARGAGFGLGGHISWTLEKAADHIDTGMRFCFCRQHNATFSITMLGLVLLGCSHSRKNHCVFHYIFFNNKYIEISLNLNVFKSL